MFDGNQASTGTYKCPCVFFLFSSGCFRVLRSECVQKCPCCISKHCLPCSQTDVASAEFAKTASTYSVGIIPSVFVTQAWQTAHRHGMGALWWQPGSRSSWCINTRPSTHGCLYRKPDYSTPFPLEGSDSSFPAPFSLSTNSPTARLTCSIRCTTKQKCTA